MAAFERATAARPNDTQALLFLAKVARRLELWDTMVTAVRRLVQLDPANPRSHRVLIKHLSDSADYDAAITAAAEAIERFPEDVSFRVDHAVRVAKQSGDVTLFRRVMNDVPPTDRLSWPMASLLLYRGVFADTNEAVAWIEAADPAAHSYATAYYRVNFNAGIHLLEGGDTEGAHLRFKAAYGAYSARLEARDEAQRLYFVGFLSLLAALAGEQEAALEYREIALAHAATTDDVLTANNTRRNAALTLAVLGDVDEAWREFEPLIGEPRGLTEWDLFLRIDFSHFFADSKGYQARVAQLKARK